jgi:ligand-binding SRPBCC domain-containing protein
MRDRSYERLVGLLGTGARPLSALKTLKAETVVPASRDATFAFFSDARNLERLTPPWINFRIRTPLPILMQEGTIIDYHIALYGMPVPWRTRIDVWEAGARFVDRQVAGPYVWWRHEHRFEAVAAGTRVVDEVEYLPRVAPLSSWLVARDVARIFAFRQRSLGPLLTGAVAHS